MPLRVHNIFPPSKGLFKPYKAFNPLLASGRATTFRNWRIRNGTIHLIEGLKVQADQTLDNALNNKMLADYKSSTRDDIIYVNAKSLRYINRGGSEVEVDSAFLATDVQSRLGWVRFRNRILIATPDTGLHWYDPSARTSRKAGVPVPTTKLSVAVGAAGVLNSTYSYKYTNVNDQGHESNPSAVSSDVAPTNDKVDLTDILVGPTGTSKRRIYRTAAAGATYLFLTTINDNSTTIYTDNTADTALGSLLDEDNDIPETDITQIFADASRVYLIQGNGTTLWASKIDNTTSEPQWEAFPSKLNLDLPFVGGSDKMKCGFFIGEDGYVMGRLSIYKIIGDVGSGVTLVRLPYDMGILTPFAYVLTPSGIVFLNNFHQLMLLTGKDGEAPINLGKEIQAILDLISENGSLDGPDLSYDPLANSVHINYALTSGGNTNGLILSLDDGSLTTHDWDADISYYSESQKTMYFTQNGDSTLNEWSTDFRDITAQYGGQQVEWFAWSPRPGSLINFARIRIIARTQKIVSDVPPTLKVEFALDGSDLYQTRFIDLTEDYLIHGEGGGPVSVVKDIGIYKKARYLTIRISSVNTTPSINTDMEIYNVQVLTKELAEAKTHGTIQGEDNILDN